MANRRREQREGSPIDTKDLPAAGHWLDQVFKTMKAESDRGCLLVGLSEVDNRLGILLSSFLTEHGGDQHAKWLLDQKAGGRPLATLAVRAKLARCLGLIHDEVLTLIDELRVIRNTHAHGTAKFRITNQDIAHVMSAIPDEVRPLIEQQAKERERGGGRVPVRKLMFAMGLAAMMLDKALNERKQYNAAFKHLLDVADKAIPKGDNKSDKPGVRRQIRPDAT